MQICVRGLVHVFKYLDNVATKEERVKSGGFVDGHGTLRRTGGSKPPANAADSNKYNTLGSNRRTHNAAASVNDSHPYTSSLHDSFEKRSPSTPIESWSPTHQQHFSASEVDSRLSPQSIRNQFQSGVSSGRSLDSAIDVELKSNSTEYSSSNWLV